MKDLLLKILDRYQSNKIVLIIISAVLGAILTKTIPAIWSGLRKATAWIGKVIGGRFAFKSFRAHYLEWLIAEYSELKLTGIVTSDDAKKPRLEQVFISLQVARNQGTDESSIENLASAMSLPSWSECQEILVFQRKDLRGAERRKGDQLLKDLRKARLRNVIAMLNSSIRLFYRRKIDGIISSDRDREERRRWLIEYLETFPDSIADLQLRLILSQEKRIAILGVPGAGKTTLLQYLAITYARERVMDAKLRAPGILNRRLGNVQWRLPIFVRLSSVASLLVNGRRTDRDASILDILPRILPPDLQANSVALQFFTYHLKHGNCLFLLDGLDEIPTDAEFEAVVRAIRSLSLTYGGNAFVITSRIAGWRSGVGGEFETFYVGDLSNKQVDVFIDMWYSAVERNGVIGRLHDESHADRVARERRASGRAADLKATLAANPGVRRLATNPMLLSIITVVHRSLATLPRERSKLYAQCCKILLEQWDISRGLRVDDTRLKLEQKEAIMRRLAHAFHTGDIGDKGGGRDATVDQVKAILIQMLPSLGRPIEDATHLLDMLIQRSGILIERQRGILSFAHQTFQEYFCAQFLAISEREPNRDFLLRSDSLSSDWWREVILLYCGLLSDSSDFIRKIQEGTATDLCLTRLRLAALCLGEAVEVKEPKVREFVALSLHHVRSSDKAVKPSAMLRHEEVDYLIQWAKTQRWYEAAAKTLLNDLTLRGNTLAARGFVLAALDNSQSVVRQSALLALPSLRLATDSQVPEWIYKKLDDDDGEVRLAAIRSVAKTHIEPQTLSKILLKALSSNDKDIVLACLELAANLADKIEISQQFFATFLDLWKSLDAMSSERILTASIEMFPFTDPAIVAWYLNRLLTQNLLQFLIVTESLRDLPPMVIEEEVRRRIIEALSDRKQDLERVLRFMGHSNCRVIAHETIVTCLMDLLASKHTSNDAIHVLVQINRIDPKLISTKLLETLLNGGRRLRSAALKIIASAERLQVSGQIVDSVFRSSRSLRVELRAEGIRALVVVKEERYRAKVLRELSRAAYNRSDHVRVAAIETLGNYVQDGEDLGDVRAITDAISDNSYQVRLSALRTLRGRVVTRHANSLISLLRKRLLKRVKAQGKSLMETITDSLVNWQFEAQELLLTLSDLGAMTQSDEVLSTIIDVLKTHDELAQPDSLRWVASIDEFQFSEEDIRFHVFSDSSDIHGVEVTTEIDAHAPSYKSPLRNPIRNRRDNSLTLNKSLGSLVGALPENLSARMLIEGYKDAGKYVKLLILSLLFSAKTNLGIDGLQELLVSALNDPEKIIRGAAIITIRQLKDYEISQGLVGPLLKTLTDPDSHIRDMAWTAIENSRAFEARSTGF